MNLLIVFVKAPVPGRVKTRLCPPLTPEEAADLYRRFVEMTVACARTVAGAEVRAAYESSPEFPDLSWLPGAPPWFAQQGVDLGDRLARAFQAGFDLGAERVAIIGSDSPDLPAIYLERALTDLERSPAVLGPAFDGGYYLVGLSRPLPDLFRGIPWSTPRVTAATLVTARRLGVEVALLPPWEDVDDAATLQRLRNRLAQYPGTPPATPELPCVV